MPSSTQWTCEVTRSHGFRCGCLNDEADETCGACGADRPVPHGADAGAGGLRIEPAAIPAAGAEYALADAGGEPSGDAALAWLAGMAARKGGSDASELARSAIALIDLQSTRLAAVTEERKRMERVLREGIDMLLNADMYHEAETLAKRASLSPASPASAPEREGGR